MKKLLIAAICSVASLNTSFAMDSANPVIFKGMLKHLEHVEKSSGETSLHWDAEAWLGTDINKLWLKSEGERHEGKIEQHRIQLLYNRAVLAYWDVQLGLAHDTKSSPSDNWLALGIHGTAPYFIDTEVNLLIGEHGFSTLDMSLAQEWMLTQRWALEPEISLNANSKDSTEFGLGSGLSQLEASLRLHYEVRREFAPYVGIASHRYLGDTKSMRNDNGDSQVMIGISAWF